MTRPPFLDPTPTAQVPAEVKLLEKELELRGGLIGAKTKEENCHGRIIRYNLLMPLAYLHPRYRNWINDFLAALTPTENNLAFWLSMSGRSLEAEWNAYKHKRSTETKAEAAKRKARLEAGIHAKPIEPNWKKAMSSKLVRRWV